MSILPTKINFHSSKEWKHTDIRKHNLSEERFKLDPLDVFCVGWQLMDLLMMCNSFLKIESQSSFDAATYYNEIMLNSHHKEIKSESET